MSTNAYARLRRMLPAPSLLAGTVTAGSGGTYTVALPGGATVVARGVATVGQDVFVRDGVIEALAPTMTVTVIEV